MTYEYFVHTVGLSTMDGLEDIGKALENALNAGEHAAHTELGWELWQVNTLSDSSGVGNNGLLLIYRKPKA